MKLKKNYITTDKINDKSNVTALLAESMNFDGTTLIIEFKNGSKSKFTFKKKSKTSYLKN